MTFKKINPKEKIFYYIEINPTTVALYDSEFDQPLVYGSKNLVSAVITKLNPKIKITYYSIKDGEIEDILSKSYDER